MTSKSPLRPPRYLPILRYLLYYASAPSPFLLHSPHLPSDPTTHLSDVFFEDFVRDWHAGLGRSPCFHGMNLFIKVPWALLFQDEQARSGANTGANGAQVAGQVLRAGKYVEQMERSFRAPPMPPLCPSRGASSVVTFPIQGWFPIPVEQVHGRLVCDLAHPQ